MYNMYADRVEAETGTGMLWHAVDGDRTALCARSFNAVQTPDGGCDREDHCCSRMNAVTGAVRPSLALVGDPRTPGVGGDPHGC